MSKHVSHFIVLTVVAQTLVMPIVAHASTPATSLVAIQDSTGAKCSRKMARLFGPRDQLRAPTCKARRHEVAGIGGPACDPHYTGKGHEVWRLRASTGPRASLSPPQRERIESCSM